MSESNGKSFITGIKTWFEELPKAKRQRVAQVGIGGTLVALLLFSYFSGKDDKPVKQEPLKEVTTVKLGDSRLEDDIRAQFEKDRGELVTQNKALGKEMEQLKADDAARSAKLDLMMQALKAMDPQAAREADKAGAKSANSIPDDPAEWANAPARSGDRLNRNAPVTGTPVAPAIPVPVPVVYVGDIGVAADPALGGGITGGAAERNRKESQRNRGAQGDDVKKNGPAFFLPVSFMPAKLLTGLKAKTVDSAKEDPEPMLLRVQAPAVLPNEVRAQLAGCFVIAHGYGSLASERVEARLVSLSCVDYEGKSVIEEPIKGILVDKDGVKGLAGHPVTKMGANLSRMFVAGLVEGAGEAFASTATTTSVSALGQTQSIDTGQIGKAAAGKGVSTAAGELTKIYAELVRQSSPVIEVGPSKEVAVLVTEGAWLHVEEVESNDVTTR